jgi:zinc protease
MLSLKSTIAAGFGSIFFLASAIPASARPSGKATTSRPAAASPVIATQGPSVEGVNEYDYPNGFKLVLVRDASKPTVTVNITYFVGSRHEGYGERGMAHLLEHLLFKGTPTTPNPAQALTDHGARFNGTTSFDRTNYYETMPATDANLEWAIRFEADRMVKSWIAKKDLDSEMTVVRNELEAGENSPSRILYERVLSAAYLWHNYGMSTIGSRSDLENVPIDRLQAFYRKYYQPDNAMLVVAGKFDPGKVLKLVGQTFGAAVPPKREIVPTYTVEPVQDGERQVMLRRVGDVQTLLAAYHIPAGSHPDSAPLSVLAEVLGATPAGRLHKALVETKKAASVGAGARLLREPGVLTASAQVRKEDSLEAARSILTQVIEEAGATSPTTQEVERAKNSLLKNFELALASSENVGLLLTEFAAEGDWRLLFLYRDRIRKVAPADVQRVAASYLKASNRTLGLFIPTDKPDRSEIPAQPNVAELVRDYKGDPALAAGEEFEATPQNIEARTRRSVLPGGMKLAMLPKKTRGATVVAQLNLRFGDEKSLANRKAAPSLAGRMLLRGTQKKTRQQIKDELDRLKARVNVFGGAAHASISIEAKHDEFPQVLKLVAEVLREPAFDPKEFELLKQESLAQVENAKPEPTTQAQIAFGQHLRPWPKGHAYHVDTSEESIQDLKTTTLEEVQKFYRDFYGASFSQMAIVGDFDPQQAEALISERIAPWKNAAAFARIPVPYRDIAPKTIALETPDKANAFFIAGLNLGLRDDDPDYPGLVVANYLLGAMPLSSRLAARLRQKDGLSYGAGSSVSASAFDKEGSFTAYALYAPENVSRLEKGFAEEIERATQAGFTAEEVSQGKAALLQSRRVTRAQDQAVAGTLATYLFYDRTYNWDAELDRKISALTSQEVSDSLRRHLDRKKITVVKAGDFAQKRAAAQPVARPGQP